MDTLIDKIFEVFSLEYMFSVVVASYLILKMVDAINGNRTTPTWVKRLVTCVVGAIMFNIFIKFTEVTFQCLMASFFSAVFLYDTAIKIIIKKLNIGYRE